MQLQDKSTIAPRSYDIAEWHKGYRSVTQELDYEIDEIEGEIPVELNGTLFRNGPGLLDINGQPFHHPFDGDGMVCAIAFQNGRAHFRNRFVRTEAFVEEQQAGRILYRGVFGTQKPGGILANAFDCRIKNIANTNVIYWGGKLLALWEAAEPYRLDPQTLETLGKDDLDGLLPPGGAIAAHPHVDPVCAADGGTPCLVNFAMKPGLSTTLTVYEFSPSGRLLRKRSHATPGFAFIHDFAISEHYAIFFQNPVSFNPLPWLLGLRGAGQCITFQTGKPTQAIIVPRFGNAPVKTIPVEAGFVFHHANAFEQDNVLVVDSICYEALPSVEPGADYRQTNFESLAPGQLWRFRFDLERGTVEQQRLEDRCVEFPSVHPNHVGRPYRYAYMGAAHHPTGNAPLQAILKLDLLTGDRQLFSLAPHGYAGEPVFVPFPDGSAEDDGWVLSLFFNGKQERSELVILDARDLTQGAIARLTLKQHIPYGLHGNFYPMTFHHF